MKKIISLIIIVLLMGLMFTEFVISIKPFEKKKKMIELYEHWEPVFPPWMDDPSQIEQDLPIRDDTWFGMSFTVGASGPNIPNYLHSFKLKMLRYDQYTAPGTITLNVYNVDGSGSPAGNPISTGTFDGLNLHVNLPFEYYEVFVYPRIKLQPNEQYCFILHGTQTDEIELESYITQGWYTLPDGEQVEYTIPNYSGGAMIYSNDGNIWNQLLNQPIVFQEYGTRILFVAGSPRNLFVGGYHLNIDLSPFSSQPHILNVSNVGSV